MVIGKKTGELYIPHTTSDSNGVAVSIGKVSGTYPGIDGDLARRRTEQEDLPGLRPERQGQRGQDGDVRGE